ncbi:hypothetical protein [Sporosalibacterium faouarense]|uniref:hypothetical protein n=1 Tax=Sporosalibacterium faouarense TaxID=516123 RepID=UPI00192BF499|nr:hypothetical protein [Sporosalibacterium faouarense]
MHSHGSKIVILLVCIILVVGGCNDSEGLKVTEIKIDKAKSKVKEVIENSIDKNGIYLLQQGDNTIFLYLNGSIVETGEKAPYYENIEVVSNEDSLEIYFEEKFSSDYSESIPNRVLYEIVKDKDYEYLKVFKNGTMTHFDTIYLIGK